MAYDPLSDVLEEFGPPDGPGPVPYEEAERYRGRVPDRLIEFWVRHGWGSWRDGLFWLCDPEPLMEPMHDLFAGDPEIDAGRLVPYFRDAFGDVTCWHPELKVVDVNPLLGRVGNTDITKKPRPGKVPFTDDTAVASGVASAVFDFYGWIDAESGVPVFEAVRERLGPLAVNEVYTMNPHFRVGGSGHAEDFGVGKLVEYLYFCFQLGPIMRTRYIAPAPGERSFGRVEEVRPIGQP